MLCVTQIKGFGMCADPVVSTWGNRVRVNSGTLAVDSVKIAGALHAQLASKPYYTDIVALYPLLGSNLAAARVPLIDKISVGIATNVGFVDGDFSQSTGLQGNGSSKRLRTLLASDTHGIYGLGWWDNNLSFTGGDTIVIGNTYTDAAKKFLLSIASASSRFWHGANGNTPTSATASANGFYYGQRITNSSRKLFKAGVEVAANTTSDVVSCSGEIQLFAYVENGTPWYCSSRCACAILTNGLLEDAEVLDLYNTINTWLIAPTGR